MTKESREKELLEKSNFVFKGTLMKLNAATLDGVPVTSKTAVVRVDSLIQAAEVLEYYGRTEITVQLGKNEVINPGQQAIFYTNSLVVGESLVVRSIGHNLLKEKSSASAKNAESSLSLPPIKGLKKHIAGADMVVTGQVTSVKVLQDQNKDEGNLTTSSGFISEHNPVWQEATIIVNQIEKGSGTSRKLKVRFPQSTDVRWYASPKLRAGQEGIFLLQKPIDKNSPEETKTAKALSKKNQASTYYTVIEPGTVQPLKNIEKVRLLIKETNEGIRKSV
jgi:hypothetical protein